MERLPEALRPKAEAMLLKAMDREALYTIVGGLKPISSGFHGMYIDVENADLTEAEEIQQILSVFTCGPELVAGLQPFAAVHDGRRFLEASMFHTASVRQVIERHRPLFGYFGVTPSTDPLAVVMAFDSDPTPRRFEAYGHLFGYPAYAVRFFVDAASEQRLTGEFVERDFISIPTFERETHAFVYAAPKGHVLNEEDRALRDAAMPIFERYVELRARYIGEGKPGIVELIRDWFDDGTGRCSPSHALRKLGSENRLAAAGR
jgi:hypothetical protein